MATDIARRSFDKRRYYTGVTTQQGRVTLEAEENEHREIVAEERRLELLDIVGPAGTPDDGYAVGNVGSGGFQVGAGTMYVGGIRVELPAMVHYNEQPDWLDRPDGGTGSSNDQQEGKAHVVLVLRETDVTATEDPVLREVALGGPDAAARLRLLQHIECFATEASDCNDAMRQTRVAWAEHGLEFFPDTMALESDTRLDVEWDLGDTDPDPCEPASKGGYLGADNQAIRVQIASVGDGGSFSLLWGFDNASFLYRATIDAQATQRLLTLDRSPVDDYHRPRVGQAVQVLRATADLAAADSQVEGYVAALDGAAMVLTSPYDPDTKTLQLPTTYMQETPQLFLRVWEELIEDVKLDELVPLGTTGVNVRVTIPSGAPSVHAGDYWTIGVRPSTPDTVLPDVLLRAAQPPDGPRMWACPLAVIDWAGKKVLDDCRVTFKPLVDRDTAGCCTLSVQADDANLRGLQAIIDAAVAGRPAPDRAHEVTVCLAPGKYVLDQPLRLGAKHGHLRLEGCGNGVVLAANVDALEQFGDGLIVAVHADNLRITGIEFELPQVAGTTNVQLSRPQMSFVRGPVQSLMSNMWTSIALRPIHCAMLEVERCLFRFTVGDATTVAEAAAPTPRNVFGVGVFAGSECWGLRVERNQFLHDVQTTHRGAAGDYALHLLVGFLLAPSVMPDPSPPVPTAKARAKATAPAPGMVRSWLTHARICDNEFSGLAVAVVCVGDVGDVVIDDNVVRDCYGGVWIESARALAFADAAVGFRMAAEVPTATSDAVAGGLSATLNDPILQQLLAVAVPYPLPTGFPTSASALVRTGTVADAAGDNEWMRAFYDRALGTAVSPSTALRAAKATKVTKATSPAATQRRRTRPFTIAAFEPATPQVLAAREALTALAPVLRAAPAPTVVSGPQLRVCGNDIDCAFAGTQLSGPAVMIWGSEAARGGQQQDDSSLMLTNNRFTAEPLQRSDGQTRVMFGPVVYVALYDAVVCDANIVRHRVQEAYSVQLIADRAVVAAGNVFVGTPIVSGFGPTWPLNTQG